MEDQPPERPIEKALARYRKERDEAQPHAELHPATKEVLLGEVRRVYDRKPEAAKGQRGFWFRFAIAGPAFALLMTSFFIFQHVRENKRQLREEAFAMAERSVPAPAESQFADAETADQIEGTSAAMRPAEEAEIEAGDLLAQTAPAAAPVTAPAAAKTATGSSLAMEPAAESVATAGAPLAASRPEAKASSAPQSGLLAGARQPAPRILSFRALNPEAATKRHLARFQFKRDGSFVEITGSDGTLYRGNLEAPTPARSGSGVIRRKEAARYSAAVENAGTPTAFRLTGTPKKAKQVTIEGVLPPDAAPVAQDAAGENAGHGRTRKDQPSPASLRMTVRTGDEPPIVIEAIPEE